MSAIPAIAAFLGEHDATLRHTIERHKVESSYNPKETKAELQERLEDELMEVEDESASKVETIEELKGKVVTAQKGASKARIEAHAPARTRALDEGPHGPRLQRAEGDPQAGGCRCTRGRCR